MVISQPAGYLAWVWGEVQAPVGLTVKSAELQVAGAALGVDEGAGGGRVHRAVLMAQEIEHHLPAVIQLEAEPVPAR